MSGRVWNYWFYFLTRLSKLHAFCRDESWISKHFFWYVFGLLVSIFFHFWRAFLWEGFQNCNFCLQKIFLKRWQVLRNIFFCFWVWSRKFLTFGMKLLHGFKNWSSSDHRIFFEEGNASRKTLIPDFFRNLSGKLLRCRWIFSGDLSKGNLWLQRSF